MKHLRILHLEDSDADASLIQAIIRRDGLSCEFVRAQNHEEFASAVENAAVSGRFDLILADFNLPQFDGLSALKLALTKVPALPFIFVSGTMGEDVAVEALKSGATDYVLKNRLDKLSLSITRAVLEAENRRKRVQTEDALRTKEELLRHAQKMEVVGRLAGGIAHDFNNLLTAIIGYRQILEANLSAGPVADECLSVIRQASERGARLTRQLLAFSRRQPSVPARVDLNRSVRELGQLLLRTVSSDIEISIQLGEPAGFVLIDPSHLDQVVMNLCINAKDAMPRGGRLILRTAAMTADAVFCREHPDMTPGDYLLLAVKDTGCGMTDEVRRRVFEPFFTTKQEGQGTGLGLAIVGGVVREAHGGIDLITTPGEGTEFIVYLPRVSAPSAEDAGAGNIAAPPHGRETILVVEDDPLVGRLTVKMLESLGYAARLAQHGAEALTLLGAGNLQPQLVVADLVMPGMGGVELAGRLRKSHPGVKILYVSGFVQDPAGQDLMPPPGAELLPKPFSHESLAAAVRRVLDAPAPAAASGA